MTARLVLALVLSSQFLVLSSQFEMPSTLRVGILKPGGGYTITNIQMETYVARVLAGEALLALNPQPNRVEIREAIAGNLCLCIGYQQVVDALQAPAGSLPVQNQHV